jgi:hypothetical protein
MPEQPAAKPEKKIQPLDGHWMRLIAGLSLVFVVSLSLQTWWSARERSAARQESRRNLRKIGRAFLRKARADGELPSDLPSTREEKPLLSWRVAILPSLGEEEL